MSAVVPDAVARQVPTPQITGKETRPDAEFVTKVITVRNIPATQLVPILRPMIPQMGHLAALPCVNKLIYVDTFANLQRLQAVIEALDVGEPYKPAKCDDGSSTGTMTPRRAWYESDSNEDRASRASRGHTRGFGVVIAFFVTLVVLSAWPRSFLDALS